MSRIKTLNVHFTQEQYDFLSRTKPGGMTWRDFVIEIVKAYNKKNSKIHESETSKT